MLKRVNSIFNTIDEKINNSITNNDLLKDIKFNINIDSVDKIIEKFTDIYIEDYLLDDKITPRSVLRKLLINLTLFQTTKINSNNTIIIIDDIDISLDEKEIFNLIKLFEKNENIKFIISSSRNIYPYIKEKSNVYKLHNNNLKNIINIDGCIKETLITNEYNKTQSKDNYESFYEENEYLINEEDMIYFKNKIIPNLSHQIGLMYSNDLNDIDFENIITTMNELEKLYLKIIYRNLTS